ncbi:MAG: ABC transporter permease [Clostridia bacterium]|nr:ABC transporter permease [Clostridia bacterium]
MSKRYSALFQRFSKHKMAVFCLFLLALMIIMAVCAPLITPYSPTKPSGKFQMPPSDQHLLGTDKIGRDMFARILYATRVSLLVGLLSTLIATLTGVTLGLISGYFGGIIDKAIMGFTDMVMSFPYILLVLVAAAIFRPGMWSIVLILGFVDWPGVARLVRGNVLSLRETNFIKSDITAGMPGSYILFSEILPNTIAPVLVYATNVFAVSILDEAALSFLGMGIQPPTPSLGNILNGAESLSILTGKPWLWLPAGIVIFLLVICINFVGDALRDAFDPRGSRL